MLQEIKQAELIARVNDINQVVWDSTVFVEVLATADIQPAIHLAGVCRDDFALQVTRRLDCEGRFAGSRWPENNEKIHDRINPNLFQKKRHQSQPLL